MLGHGGALSPGGLVERLCYRARTRPGACLSWVTMSGGCSTDVSATLFVGETRRRVIIRYVALNVILGKQGLEASQVAEPGSAGGFEGHTFSMGRQTPP